MAMTTVLLDSIHESSETKQRLSLQSPSRPTLVEGIIQHLDSTNELKLKFLVDDEWVPVSQFILNTSPLPRFVRCLVEEMSSPTLSGMLPWRRFGHITFGEGGVDDLVVGEGYHIHLGKSVESADGPHGATGRTLWDGSLFLASFLNLHPDLVRGQNVIELGAGQGIVGVCAAVLGARSVLMTDLPYALPGCISTVEANSQTFQSIVPIPVIGVEELDWFEPPMDRHMSANIILAADVVWVSELVAPFVRTLAALCPSHDKTKKVILSYQRRGKDADEELWGRLKEVGFRVEGPVVHSPTDIERIRDADASPPLFEINIFVLSRP